MKKILSILAAIGLTATTSTAVVACGNIKNYEKPTYENVMSIEEDTYLNDNQVIYAGDNWNGNLNDFLEKQNEFILGTIASQFKNGEDLMKDKESFSYNLISYEYIDNSSTNLILNIQIIQNKNNNDIPSKPLKIKMSNKNYYSQNIENKPFLKFDIARNALNEPFNLAIKKEMRRLINDPNISTELEIKNSVFGELWNDVLTSYAKIINYQYSVGFDEHGVRYNSFSSQIKDSISNWKESAYNVNRDIIEQLRSFINLYKLKEPNINVLNDDFLKIINDSIKQEFGGNLNIELENTLGINNN